MSVTDDPLEGRSFAPESLQPSIDYELDEFYPLRKANGAVNEGLIIYGKARICFASPTSFWVSQIWIDDEEIGKDHALWRIIADALQVDTDGYVEDAVRREMDRYYDSRRRRWV